MAEGKPIYVIPNALDFSQYKKRKCANKKLRIGFQGSNIHSSDLLIMIDALAQLQKEYDFEFHIFGIDDRPFKELYEFCKKYKGNFQWVRDFMRLYEVLEGMQYIHHKTVPYERFRAKLSELDLDIGICPLADNSFNRSKSCLKFYEYAAVGTVALASDVVPYNQEMDKEDLVRNKHQKWYNKLKRLIEDEQYRNERLHAQSMWVFKNRNIEDVVRTWESTYNLIINNKSNEKNSIDPQKN